ncbi:unnamed protein product [Rotaria sordida]|uniref:Uncharacterized protein n=1 Tax=Rotaria sordida TaxID=392033 RepID=A0A814LLQ1_9BILA|nr:unnamed protein product [Rotaria sordida]
MEENIYQMSLSEIFLVLIIIALWLFAVINLARKLERICNPPSILPNYSKQNKIDLNTPIRRGHYSPNTIQSKQLSSIHLIRSTSEPTIIVSPCTTIHIRYPSETCLNRKSSKSEQILSPNRIELERSNNSLNFLRHKDYRIRIETKSKQSISTQQYLNPKRIPSIVRRSLLDLHRRTLYSNTLSNIPMNHCIVNITENHKGLITTNTSLINEKYQHENNRYKNIQSNN